MSTISHVFQDFSKWKFDYSPPAIILTPLVSNVRTFSKTGSWSKLEFQRWFIIKNIARSEEERDETYESEYCTVQYGSQSVLENRIVIRYLDIILTER